MNIHFRHLVLFILWEINVIPVSTNSKYFLVIYLVTSNTIYGKIQCKWYDKASASFFRSEIIHVNIHQLPLYLQCAHSNSFPDKPARSTAPTKEKYGNLPRKKYDIHPSAARTSHPLRPLFTLAHPRSNPCPPASNLHIRFTTCTGVLHTYILTWSQANVCYRLSLRVKQTDAKGYPHQAAARARARVRGWTAISSVRERQVFTQQPRVSVCVWGSLPLRCWIHRLCESASRRAQVQQRRNWWLRGG